VRTARRGSPRGILGIVVLIPVVVAGGVWLVLLARDTTRAIDALNDLGEFELKLAESHFCFGVEAFPPAQSLLKMGTGTPGVNESNLLLFYDPPEKEVPKAVARALQDLREGVTRVANGEPAPVVVQELQPQLTTIQEHAATAC
jgi:hypothetical protein